MRPPTHSLELVAVVAIVATGLIHLGTAPESFGEEPEAWLEPLGIASLVAELVFSTVFAVTRRPLSVA